VYRYTGSGRQPDIGDSAITDGGRASAWPLRRPSPYVGVGGFGDAIQITNEMLETMTTRNPTWRLHARLRRAPTGIDVRLVAKWHEPIINTESRIARLVSGKSGPHRARADRLLRASRRRTGQPLSERGAACIHRRAGITCVRFCQPRRGDHLIRRCCC
jgi:hypothetical protein